MNSLIIAKGSRESGNPVPALNPVPLPDTFKIQAAVALSTTAAEVWAAATGRRIRLLGGVVTVSSAAVLILQDNAGTPAVKYRVELAAGVPHMFDLGFGQLLDSGLKLDAKVATGTATLNGTLWGTWE